MESMKQPLYTRSFISGAWVSHGSAHNRKEKKKRGREKERRYIIPSSRDFSQLISFQGVRDERENGTLKTRFLFQARGPVHTNTSCSQLLVGFRETFFFFRRKREREREVNRLLFLFYFILLVFKKWINIGDLAQYFLDRCDNEALHGYTYIHNLYEKRKDFEKYSFHYVIVYQVKSWMIVNEE